MRERPAPAGQGTGSLWALIATGVAARLLVAVLTHGLPYDVDSFELVRRALSAHPLHMYSLVNAGGSFHWPYPPGFLPLVVLSSDLADVLGGGFAQLIRIPSIVADATLSWLVWRGLEGRVDERSRLRAAAVVSLGPVFIAISGYAAQIDSVAILPAAMGLLVWERSHHDHRAWIAGGLIGLGACIKTVPLLMLLALLPTARSRQEAGILIGSAFAVLLLPLAPFLVADSSGALGIRHYAGAPGMGGLSLVLQPNLAQLWLTRPVAPNHVISWLFVKHPTVLNLATITAFAGYAWRFRPAPRPAAAVLWLMVLAFGSGFFFQYLIWVLPFLLLAGHIRAATLLQAAITLPMLLFYVTAWRSDGIVPVYVAVMLIVWLGWVGVGAAIAKRGAFA
ncbi:MAG: glycosyltransferase 87 family protein [Solirubrobacteraceae bacterium]